MLLFYIKKGIPENIVHQLFGIKLDVTYHNSQSDAEPDEVKQEVVLKLPVHIQKDTKVILFYLICWGSILILNHLIVIFNAFGIEHSVNMLKVKLDERHWPVIKPFLIFLKYITNDELVGIKMDERVIETLRKI